MDATISIAGERLILAPERAAMWVSRSMLLVADPHFAKAATFRAGGVFVPRGTTKEGITRLDALIARFAPASITFLGDFLHAREGRNDDTFSALEAWRSRHATIDMRLVRGNHDVRAGDPPSSVGITCVDGPLLDGAFVLAHHPVADHRGYVLAGHVHPCVIITGPARERIRLPCFHFGQSVAVFPAFGEFTGCVEHDAEDGDQIWGIADDSVIRIR